MNPKYVYVMKDLSKSWSGGKQVIKNASLSFIDGAKIGDKWIRQINIIKNYGWSRPRVLG